MSLVNLKIKREINGHILWWIICSMGGMAPPINPIFVYMVLTSPIIKSWLWTYSNFWSIFGLVITIKLIYMYVASKRFNSERVGIFRFYYLPYLFILWNNYIFNVKNSSLKLTAGIFIPEANQFCCIHHSIYCSLLFMETLGDCFSSLCLCY